MHIYCGGNVEETNTRFLSGELYASKPRKVDAFNFFDVRGYDVKKTDRILRKNFFELIISK